MTRVGVMGVGGMGSGHCGALKQVPTADFVGVYDVRQEAVDAAAQKFEVRGFTDVDAFLEAVDAVVVATPPDFHRTAVARAAAAGRHVFCEKPLAANLADCDAMIQACDATRVVLQSGMVLRFYPVHELARQLVDDGAIGQVVYIEGDYAGPFRGGRQRPASWYGQLGGYLENGIHKVDLVNWFGGHAQSVSAEVGSWSGHEDWEDYAVSVVRYDSGAVATLRWGGFMGARGDNGTFLDGTLGTLRLDIRGDTVHRKLLGEREWTALEPPNKGANGVISELTHFIACAEGEEPCRVDGRAGKHAVEVVLAGYASARDGAKIALPFAS